MLNFRTVLVMLWSWLLWERNRPLMLGTLALFIMTQVVTIGFCIATVVLITGEILTLYVRLTFRELSVIFQAPWSLNLIYDSVR
jgi:hypothetical protein